MSENTLPSRRENFKKLHRRHNVWRWSFSFFLALVFTLFVCFVWFRWVKMGNDSMAPTLQKGNLVLVDRLYKYFTQVERTDIIAYYRPGTEEMLIKRVVAVGGESVCGKNGSIWIDERYRLFEEEYGAARTPDFDTVEVPKGYVFVLSDDRQFMEDSREKDIGCIPISDIVGVMHIRLLPSLLFYR